MGFHHILDSLSSIVMLRHFSKMVPIFLVALTTLLFPFSGCAGQPATVKGGIINVVAGENFWGNIAVQLGGRHVNVISLVTAPNADPHEYETTTADARTVARANYVIFNGAGYDSWGQKMLDANPVTGRKVLNVADLLGKKQGDNPHFWYSPDYVEQVVNQITQDYQELDSPDAQYFNEQHAAFENALSQYRQLIAEMRQDYGGVKIGATESIFVYMADAIGLDLTTPPAFMNSVSANSDPPAPSVALFYQQIHQKQIATLIYNAQTATLITTNIRQLAENVGIPTVAITETIIPPAASFQDWQTAQLQTLQNILSARP